MNVEDNTQIDYKNPSAELVTLMDQFSDVEVSRGTLIEKIMLKARSENISDEQTRHMIEERLHAKGLSQSTINRAIPQELKDKKMQEVRSHRQEYATKRQEQVVEFIPKPIDPPTEIEQSYIKQVEQTVVAQVPTTHTLKDDTDTDDTIYEIKKPDRDLLIKVKHIRQQGFTFNSDPELWKDTGIEIAKEFNKPEYASKTYRLLIEEVI